MRNNTIDLMRVTGLLLIIMAHTISSETLLFQLRNFDVQGENFAILKNQNLRKKIRTII